MSKVFVIPDVHLKPWIFDKAEELLSQNEYDKIVCVGDLVDDWDQEKNLVLYAETFDAVEKFVNRYPNFLLCYGNHDVSYLWEARESGYSDYARPVVLEGLSKLEKLMPTGNIAYIHRIDNVLFSHGGLSDSFVRRYVQDGFYDDIDTVVDTINSFGCEDMWQDASPIWYRPQFYDGKLYKPRKLLQVVGHTPVQEITREGNFISCDVFSTQSSGEPIGTQEFLVVDTITWEYSGTC